MSEVLTEGQRRDRIGALTRELAGYEATGNEERAGLVKEQLDHLGANAAPPQKRAAKRAKGKEKTEL